MWIVVALLVFGLLFGPAWWVKRVLAKYSQPADRYAASGTGAALARHLLDLHELADVKVEPTPLGDHYDPVARAVRLEPAHHDGSSLTAVVVAAHEVGHALQHARGERLFATRHRLAQMAVKAERVAGLMLIAAPLVALLTRLPQSGGLMLILAAGSAALATLVHLVTLPVELDASFGKALPLLAAGRLHTPDLPHARRILRAAAFTYVAGSLASLLNLGHWLAVLRR
ncbi:MAG: zinc metallopeptidase [Gammaproteobacteria bacterium]